MATEGEVAIFEESDSDSNSVIMEFEVGEEIDPCDDVDFGTVQPYRYEPYLKEDETDVETVPVGQDIDTHTE